MQENLDQNIISKDDLNYYCENENPELGEDYTELYRLENLNPIEK